MAVGAATWSLDGSHLFVEAAVGNAADGAPAPLVWTAFTLETEIGAILDAASLSAETCPGGLSIAPGATLRCEVGFAVPSGHRPVRLHYRADAERTAQAPVPACSPSTPQGLCEPGMACEAGRCIAPCSAHEPDGFCFGADQCIEGACRSLCSFENPHGWCADGTCVEGRCDASCYALDYLAEGCSTCLQALIDAGLCSGAPATCADSMACAECALDGRSVCECESSSACDGCEAQVRGAWDCLVRACPSCRA